jgi:Spy/CpxP family protein refolding chaperone
MRRLITISALAAATLLLVLPAALAQSPAPFDDDASYQGDSNSRRGMRGQRGPDGRRGGKGMRGIGISPRMAEALELSEEQVEAVDAIKAAFLEQTSEARETTRELRTTMRELWSADEPDKAAILAVMDEMQAEKHATAVARVEAKLAVLDVLTPDQKAEMTAIRAERREQRSERRAERRERGERGQRGDCDGEGSGGRGKRGSRGSWGD